MEHTVMLGQKNQGLTGKEEAVSVLEGDASLDLDVLESLEVESSELGEVRVQTILVKHPH